MKDHAQAPRTSQLGWDMDHVWLLRDMVWTLDGEWRSADGRWMPLSGKVVVADSTATWILEAEDAPQRFLTIHPGGGNRKITRLDLQTESVTLSGTLRSFGFRQDLSAMAGSWSLAETALQRADGSVEVDGIFTRLGEVRDAWRWILRPEPLFETWAIAPEVVAEIARIAREGAPVEQCGLLVGRAADKVVGAQVRMANTEQSIDRYAMDPAEQIKVAKSLRGTSEEIVGSWHSHPFSPARLSDEDLRQSTDENALYGIVSLMEDSPAFLLYRVRDGKALPVRTT